MIEHHLWPVCMYRQSHVDARLGLVSLFLLCAFLVRETAAPQHRQSHVDARLGLGSLLLLCAFLVREATAPQYTLCW